MGNFEKNLLYLPPIWYRNILFIPPRWYVMPPFWLNRSHNMTIFAIFIVPSYGIIPFRGCKYHSSVIIPNKCPNIKTGYVVWYTLLHSFIVNTTITWEIKSWHATTYWINSLLKDDLITYLVFVASQRGGKRGFYGSTSVPGFIWDAEKLSQK